MTFSLRILLSALLLVNAQTFVVSAALPDAAPIPRGVVFMSSDGTSSDQFALAVEFIKIESFGMTSTFTFANGKTLQVSPTRLKKVFTYPDIATMTLITESDALPLQDALTQAAALAKQYPKGAAILGAFAERTNAVLASLKQGMVFVAGKWMTQQEYKQLNAGAQNAYVPVLNVDGRVFKNAKASALQGDQLRIMHDLGFATFALTKLSDSQRKELAKTNADLAPMLIPNAATPASTQGRYAFSFVGDTVIIQLPDGQKTFPLDQVPASLTSTDPVLADAIAKRKVDRERELKQATGSVK